jgi:hypothetical protein
MKTRRLVPLVLLLLAGCITTSDHDDHDNDRSNAEERAQKYCLKEAKSRGMRVEDVGRIDKLGKKDYEVKLRIDAGKDKKDKDKDKGGDYTVYCRYDDKSRNARID